MKKRVFIFCGVSFSAAYEPPVKLLFNFRLHSQTASARMLHHSGRLVLLSWCKFAQLTRLNTDKG